MDEVDDEKDEEEIPKESISCKKFILCTFDTSISFVGEIFTTCKYINEPTLYEIT